MYYVIQKQQIFVNIKNSKNEQIGSCGWII